MIYPAKVSKTSRWLPWRSPGDDLDSDIFKAEYKETKEPT